MTSLKHEASRAADGGPPRTVRQTLLAMLGLCCVLVMVALDQTVIGTALPTVVAELHGFELYAWVGTSYLLTSVITIPIFGKLGDEHGRKPFVLAAITLFTLASMLCGAAQSMLMLVLMRALQGAGGGMLVATTFACVPDLFPDARQRLRWQVLLSSSYGIANAFGPSLGGYLAEFWGWRWVFFVNLPVGLLSLYFVWRHLPRIRHASALVWWERRCTNPVLPPDMFTHRSLAPLFTLSLLMGFCMYAVMYYAPLMFQHGFGLSPNEAGLLITPLAVSITVGSIANGRIAPRLHSLNVMVFIGLGSFTAAVLILTQAVRSTPHSLIVAAMVLGGLGLGLLLPNLTLFAQACAPRTQLGVATAMMQSTRMVGGMLGTALIGAFVTRSAQHHGELVSAIHSGQWIVVALLVLAMVVARRIPPIHLHEPAAPQDAP